jgi:hypothetical protein
LGWEAAIDAVKDRRCQAQIPISVVIRSALVMGLCRLGSLNALGQTKGSSFWAKWLGHALPSPDTVGRVAGLVDVESLRALGHHIYERLKRGKALAPPPHGLLALAVDGHETHATYKRIITAWSARQLGRPICTSCWTPNRFGPERMRWPRRFACWTG